MAEFEELKLTVTLIDNASVGLRALNAELDRLGGVVQRTVTPQLATATRGMTQMSVAARTASQAARELEQRFEGLGKGIGQLVMTTGLFTQSPVVGALGAMGAALGGVTGGVIALGAAIVGTHLSLISFSRRTLELRDMARAAGSLPAEFKHLTEELERVGYTAEQAQQEVTSFSRTVREAARGGTAEQEKILREASNPQWMIAHVQQLNRMMNQGQRGQAMVLAAQNARAIYERELNRPGGGGIQEATRQSEAYLQNIGLSMRALNIKEMRELTPEMIETMKRRQQAAEQFNKTWTDTRIIFKDITDDMKAGLLPTFSKLNELLIEIGVELKKLAPHIADAFEFMLREVRNFLRDVHQIIKDIKELNLYRAITGKEGTGPQNLPSVGGGGPGGAGDWMSPPGTPPATSGSTAPAIPGVPSVPGVPAMPGAGGATTPAAPSGGARSGDLSQEAYNQKFAGTPLAGQYQTVVDAAKRNNVPPSLMAAVMAHETGYGKSAAVTQDFNPAGIMDRRTGYQTRQRFGSIEEGINRAGEVIGRNYERGGRTIPGMASTYAPVGAANDPNNLNRHWPGNVSRLQSEFAVPNAPAPGTGFPGISSSPATSSRGDSATPPADLLSKAQQVAMHSGPGGVRQFMAANGYPMSGAWCGQFAASVVRSQGMEPPKGAAIASNWRNFGEPVQGAPQPGDVAVRRGVPTGATGSHVTFVQDYDPQSGRFTGFGGNQGRWASQYRASQFEYRRATQPSADDRSVVDKTMGGEITSRVEGTGQIDVTVNGPRGTKVNAESGGIFKRVRMNRNIQMEPAESGPPETAGIFE